MEAVYSLKNFLNTLSIFPTGFEKEVGHLANLGKNNFLDYDRLISMTGLIQYELDRPTIEEEIFQIINEIIWEVSAASLFFHLTLNSFSKKTSELAHMVIIPELYNHASVINDFYTFNPSIFLENKEPEKISKLNQLRFAFEILFQYSNVALEKFSNSLPIKNLLKAHHLVKGAYVLHGISRATLLYFLKQNNTDSCSQSKFFQWAADSQILNITFPINLAALAAGLPETEIEKVHIFSSLIALYLKLKLENEVFSKRCEIKKERSEFTERINFIPISHLKNVLDGENGKKFFYNFENLVKSTNFTEIGEITLVKHKLEDLLEKLPFTETSSKKIWKNLILLNN